MNVLVIGATGRTGRHVVRLALNEGHHVTVFVRSPEKLYRPQTGVKIVRGDALDATAIQNLIYHNSYDSLVLVVGADSLKCSTVRGDITKNVVKSLEQKNASTRIWVVSSAGTNESINQLGFFSKTFVNTILKGQILDHKNQENIVRESSLPFTIVRPVGLRDTPPDSAEKYMILENGRVATTSISRVNVADFIIKNLDNPAYLQKAVTLCAVSDKD
ncbi:NAD(P)H-binding protein [Galbibacter sp. BG1]|uniref:NAD(P)-dependent oxidoreductase n=1 Tax=Galbibacter sp. BG1 TaxID=1170699 RepID=UPI0015BCD9EC|nr:NAD(P)H-binding protein [Galbibacter sp. BG1]QLE01702.1 NAD(P)H-binding protein [Galbibacter sp. BG1]